MKAKQIKCYCGHTTYCDCGPEEEPRKQTAVEWLVEQICGDHTSEWQKQIEQAKAMEKEQIIEAVESTIKSVKLTDDKTAFFAMGGEGYYTETYESNTGI